MTREKGHVVVCLSNGSAATEEKPTTDNNVISKNVKSGQAWLNRNYGPLLEAKCGEKLVEDGSYGIKTRSACVCVWKDVVNRKYNFSLTPSNSNFLASCKKAAVKAQIKKGDSGTLPLIAQLLLSAFGFYQGAMDAKFDGDMEEAVKAYQKSKGLEVDGVIGPDTWYALFN